MTNQRADELEPLDQDPDATTYDSRVNDAPRPRWGLGALILLAVAIVYFVTKYLNPLTQ